MARDHNLAQAAENARVEALRQAAEARAKADELAAREAERAAALARYVRESQNRQN